MPVLYQHPNVQLYLDLSNSMAWRLGLTDAQASEKCDQAAWAARGSEFKADAEDALDVVKRNPSEDAFRSLFLHGRTSRRV